MLRALQEGSEDSETLYGLKRRTLDDIIYLAGKNRIRKVVLYGSRARGDHHDTSDIDLAVSGGDSLDFWEDLEELAWTLRTFDVVALDATLAKDLRANIERDGIVLYEAL